MIQEKVTVIGNEKIGSVYYRITLTCHKDYSRAIPGQFIMLGFSDSRDFMLRRPFSIHTLKIESNNAIGINLLYKVVGPTTKKLSQCKKGDNLEILGPLGRGFLVSEEANRIFMVAGGVGIAPISFLVESMIQKRIDLSRSDLFFGGRTKDDLPCKDDFQNRGIEVRLATDDGSLGEIGNVTKPLEAALTKNRPDVIYACGPWPMLKAVGKIAESKRIPCQLSVEAMMACGIGACLGCVVESRNENSKRLHACKDGPVFDSRLLKL